MAPEIALIDALGHMRLRLAADRVAHLITVRDGRIVRAEVYTDRREAIEAVGLRE